MVKERVEIVFFLASYGLGQGEEVCCVDQGRAIVAFATWCWGSSLNVGTETPWAYCSTVNRLL